MILPNVHNQLKDNLGGNNFELLVVSYTSKYFRKQTVSVESSFLIHQDDYHNYFFFHVYSSSFFSSLCITLNIVLKLLIQIRWHNH